MNNIQAFRHLSSGTMMKGSFEKWSQQLISSGQGELALYIKLHIKASCIPNCVIYDGPKLKINYGHPK